MPLPRTRQVIDAAVAGGATPSIVVEVGRRARAIWTASAGRLTSDPASPPATADTVYDLASLTKPAVALCVARLVRAGSLGWERRLGELLAEAQGTPSAGAPLALLASHRAGLEAHIRLRDSGVPREGWLTLCASARRAETLSGRD